MKRVVKASVGLIVVVVLVVAVSLYWMQSGAFNANPQPSATPNPTPTPQIQISYHSVDLGCGRQCADMTIKNEGYAAFDTNPEKFFITINGQNYTYTATFTTQFGNWQNTTVANGASYSGTLIFSNPRTTDPFTIGYDDSTYNIVWNQY